VSIDVLIKRTGGDGFENVLVAAIPVEL